MSYLFEPFNLRNKTTKFKNLSKHMFSSSEKVYICNLLIKSIESAKISNKQSFLIYKLTKRHQLDLRVIKEWLELHKLGEYPTTGYCTSSFINTPLDLIGSIIVQKAVQNNTISTDLIQRQMELTLSRNKVQARKRSNKIRMKHTVL